MKSRHNTQSGNNRIQNEDDPLNVMLPNPYGLNECPGRQGSVQYRTNKSPRKSSDRWQRENKMEVGENIMYNRRLGKYRPALKNIIPIRNGKDMKSKNGYIPVDQTGCLSTIFFSWLTPFMWKGYKQGLESSDVLKCPQTDSCFRNGSRLNSLWQDEVSKKGPEGASLNKVLFRFLRTRIIVQCLLFTVVITLGILAPAYFMLELLKFIEDDNQPMYVGILWALGLTFVELFRTVTMTGLWSMALRSAIRLRAACMHLLYKKMLVMVNYSGKSVGEMVNMFATDASSIYDAPLFIPLLIGGPLMIIAGIIYVYWILGAISLVGMVVFIAFFPIQVGISRMLGKIRKKTLTVSDQRANRMTELINCIKLIKLYAWEATFTNNVNAARNREKIYLQQAQYIQSISLSLGPSVPIVAAVVTFLAHIALGGQLTPSQAFTTLTLYYIIGMAVRSLPHELKTVINAAVSIDRIKNVLLLPNQENYVNKLNFSKNETDIDVIDISSASLTWNGSETGSQLVLFEKDPNYASYQKVGDMNDGSVGTLNSDDPMIQAKSNDDEDDLRLNSCGSNNLRNINLNVTQGSTVAIIGATGSGKSSLLCAILDQMTLVSGSVTVRGSCAYVSQEHWVLNATLRENILMGSDFDAARYYNVVCSCALNEDISHLPGGDSTQIGDRGMTLSGGQKSRLCLARAVYADRDVYLIDDCFSSLDSKTSKHIYKHVIQGILQDKTLLFVTHSVQYLEQCDDVVMMKNGCISDTGCHNELLKRNESYCSLIEEFNNLENEKSSLGLNYSARRSKGRTSDAKVFGIDDSLPILLDRVERNEEHDETSVVSTDEDADEENQISDVSDFGDTADCTENAESVERGTISFDTYKAYMRSAGGYMMTTFVLFCFLINIGCGTFSSWWLTKWLTDGSGTERIINLKNNSSKTNNSTKINNDTNTYTVSNSIGNNPDLQYYQSIYGLSILFIFVTNVIRAVTFTKCTLIASTAIHNRLLKTVLYTPMKFFDTTPVGRILNLFTKDQEAVDARLPLRIEIFFQYLFIVLFAILVLISIIPWMLIAIIIFAFLFFFLHKIFHHTIRDIKRLHNVSWPSVFSHVAATINGVHTIRAFSKEHEFIDKFNHLYDTCSAPLFLYNSANRWIGVRLEVMAICITMITSMLVVVFRHEISPAYAGLALSYTIQFCAYFQYMVRTMSEVEANFTSVERQFTYINRLETEDEIQTCRNDGQKPVEVPKMWPKNGSITFYKVGMRYQPCLLPALRNVSFEVTPREKIGIVGKTGAGKSSLGVVLFRLVDISCGTIYVDGIDISQIPIHELRSRLSIIPQDPTMFSGTIRDNLDPVGKYTDDEIWTSLEKTFMKHKILTLAGKLQTNVTENGTNFSVGERQLLCLCRALLKSSKIILLDEATASIDLETDTLIQRTIKEGFANSTVLTIAHRLHTVRKCDKILVMENGSVAEFDKPDNLLSNPKSRFHKMVMIAIEKKHAKRQMKDKDTETHEK
ncbi:ABCC5 (predicted) [Pycnogonum litorale]